MRLLLAILTLCLAAWSQATIMIDRAVLDFPVDQPPRQDVVVTNPDPEPAFLEVEVLEVRHPGTADETRTVVKNPEALGLVASPRRLMVPPGAQRIIRLVSLKGHLDEEQVYRVNVRPAAGKVESDTMAVKILVAYQLLVFIAPRKADMALEGKRDGQSLTLKNTGNVNVSLHHGRQCPPGESAPGACAEAPGHRLYPGNEITLQLPRNAPVEYSLTAAGSTSMRRFE